MRLFDNPIRFYKLDDSEDRYKNYHEPRDMRLGVLTQKQGETIKFFAPKSDFEGIDIRTLQVGLYGEAFEDCASLGYQLLEDNIGFLREQQSRFYYEMVIKVNNAPSTTWKQFALLRPNGQQLFGTYTGQETDLDTYINNLKDWLEAYPHTRVDAYKEGNLIRLRIWESGNFIIRNEEITVGLGTVSILNENSPTLQRGTKTTYNRPAYNTYDLVIGSDVTEGNVFTLGDVTYTATKADSAATVKAALLGNNSKVVINVGDIIPINASVGTVRTVNTNNPTINDLYNDLLSGNDRYVIEVENVQKGNIFQVLRSGLSPLTIKASETDTKATIEAFFNSTGGYLVVPSGTVLTVSAVPGVRIDDNTNSPSISTANAVLTPAQMTDRWRIFIGTSVRKNNKFLLGESEVIADEDDTYLTIATKLGLIDGLYYEIEEDGVFSSYAERGALYDDENIADIQIISSPIRRISQQYLCEVTMPAGYAGKNLQIAVSEYSRNDEEQTWIFIRTVVVSNYIRIEVDPKETVMVRCSSLGEAFGFEYFEQGINQQMRFPIYLRNDGYETTLTKSQSVNDATVNGNTQLRPISDFQVLGYPSWLHKALQTWLRSDVVMLDEMKVSLINYEVSEDVGAKKIQSANGSLYKEIGIMKNYGKLFLDYDNFQEKVSIITNFKSKIICVILKNDLFCQEVFERGEIFIPVGEYRWKAWVGGAVGDTVDMRIYQNGTRIHHVTMYCGRMNMLPSLIRVYPHDELLFEEVSQENTTIVGIDTKTETTLSYESVDYVDEIGDYDKLNGYVEPFVPPAETNAGQWRDRIDGDTNLSIEQNTDETGWVLKSIIS